MESKGTTVATLCVDLMACRPARIFIACTALALGGCQKEPSATAPEGLAAARSAIVASNYAQAVELAAKEVAKRPKDPQASYELARAEAQRGNDGLAVDALEKAVGNGLGDAANALQDPAFARIANSERFAALTLRANPAPREAAQPVAESGSVTIHEDKNGTHIQAGDVHLDTDF